VLGGQASVSFARGPEYFRLLVPPNPQGSVSTRLQLEKVNRESGVFACGYKTLSRISTDQCFTF
jgi:hypothetical protein